MTKRQRELLDSGYTPGDDAGGLPGDARVFRASDYVSGDAPPRKAKEPNMAQVASRLWKKFGGGENPALRKTLYERLEREVDSHGMRAFRVIQSCVRSAESARAPDRYFCSAVANRMREAGMMCDPDEREVF